MVNGESSFSGSNISLVKKHNLHAILLTFLHNRSISRVQLAKQTSLSSTTITNLTAELIEHGIIVDTDVDARVVGQPRRRVGRPRRMLRLVADARYVVGVHIGIGIFRVAITNLHAEIMCSQMYHFHVDQPALEVLDEIVRLIQTTIVEAQIDNNLILGVGVGASGLVNHRTGVNLNATRLGWRDVPMREYLENRLGMPVCVDNNVRNMALGEAYFGLGRGVDVLAFIYGRIGVGAGIVVNGEVFRGSRAGAGEIGHTIILPHNGELCRCGQHGCLETLVSEPVLVHEAQIIAEKHPDSILSMNLNQLDGKPIECIFAAARAGDQLSRALIEHRMHYLGIALANLVNVLNPELIILGGMFAEGSDLILPTVKAAVSKLAFAGLGKDVKVQPTGFGWRAGVIGSASLALKVLFYEAPQEIAIAAQ
jgi:glucokinase-like ROK family protein